MSFYSKLLGNNIIWLGTGVPAQPQTAQPQAPAQPPAQPHPPNPTQQLGWGGVGGIGVSVVRGIYLRREVIWRRCQKRR